MSDPDFPMIHPPEEASPASGSGIKRKHSSDMSQSSSSSSPSPRKTKKPRTTFTHRPKKHKKPSDWHLKKGEVPKEAEKTKLALELHLRVLWGLPNQSAIPPKITDDDKAPFTKHFASEAHVRSSVTASLDQNSGNAYDARARVHELLNSLPDGSIISNNIKRIGECHLLVMFRTTACLGLRRWAPDILGGDPESMYNLLHEHIALTTFEQVSGAYRVAGNRPVKIAPAN